jgi:hypothetical protein
MQVGEPERAAEEDPTEGKGTLEDRLDRAEAELRSKLKHSGRPGMLQDLVVTGLPHNKCPSKAFYVMTSSSREASSTVP